jgi:hypothetical protein
MARLKSGALQIPSSCELLRFTHHSVVDRKLCLTVVIVLDALPATDFVAILDKVALLPGDARLG